MANIKKRGNTYRITVSLGNDSKGKQIREYMTYKPDISLTPKQIEKEVERQAVLFEDKCKKGLYLDGNIKLFEFAEKWFVDYAEKQLKAKTIARYRIFMKRINSAIGHIPLDKLQPNHLMAFYSNLKEDGVRNDNKYKSKINFRELMNESNISKAKLSTLSGVSVFSITSIIKGDNVSYDTALKISKSLKINIDDLFCNSDTNKKVLSDKTIHHYHAFLSSMLAKAVVWQIIFSNPCERVAPPKVTKKEAKYLEESELHELLQILDKLPEDEFQKCVMIKLLLSTGVRRGELCGLKWADIDFTHSTININRNLLYLPERGIFEDTPKTNESKREISVAANVIQMLNTYKAISIKKTIRIW